MNMGRIEQIKRDFEIFDGMTSTENQAWLLSRLQIAEEALWKYSAMIVTDSENRPHDVGMVAREALEQIQKE